MTSRSARSGFRGLAGLRGLRLGKRQCRRGLAHLPGLIAEHLRCCRDPLRQAADLGDGMLVSSRPGHEVHVPVVQVRYSQGVLPVPVGRFSPADLSRIAFQCGDPVHDPVLSQLHGPLMRSQDGSGQRARARRRIEIMLGPQVGDVAQGNRDLPLMTPQRAFRHGVGQPCLVSARFQSRVDGLLGAVQEPAAGAVQGRGRNDLIAVPELIQPSRNSGLATGMMSWEGSPGVNPRPPYRHNPDNGSWHRISPMYAANGQSRTIPRQSPRQPGALSQR